MRFLVRLLPLLLAAGNMLTASCQQTPDWTTPLRPFRIADNLYYVGSRDLASYLVVTPAGNILINSNLEISVPQIHHSVEQLGFQWNAIKILLISHAHSDHDSGSAEILKETGAKYMVMDGDVDVVESGGRTDFYYGATDHYPPAHVDRVLHDGDTVPLGNAVLTAHKTPGHTKGCTTWTMQVHVPGEPEGKLRNVVIIGSWKVSKFHLVSTPGKPASYPGIADDFTRTFAVLRALPCDIFLGAHGVYFGLITKVMRYPTEGEQIWIDPLGYKLGVDEHEDAFKRELAKEQAAAGAPAHP